jgi:spermidine synthase
MRHVPLYLVAFVSGAAVLAIEILGTRALGPFYGVTLFLWSALITVTLVALSVGYVIGGRQAERATMKTLAALLAGAGVWMLLVAWLRQPIIVALEPVGLRVAVLAAAGVLFGPPLTLLGMVSPIAVRVRARKLREVGRAAGDLFAISTVGGVLAALVTGFYLIPNVGVARLTLLIGATLILTALASLVSDRPRRGKLAGGAGVVLLAVASLWGDAPGDADPKRGLIHVEQSPYGELRVLDYGDGSRHLLIDGGVHSSVMIDSWDSLQGYIWVSDIAKQLAPRRGRMLLIGLGAGSTANSFLADGWQVDAVEIDPAVTRIARKHFGLRLAPEHIVDADGRQVLRRSRETYELVVLDAFASNSIPAHLFTTEAFALVAQRLRPDGVLAMNIESLAWDSVVVRSIGATLREQFAHVLALPVAADPEALSNLIVVASAKPFPEQLRFDAGTAQGQQRMRSWRHRFVPETAGATVLRDDLSPVDVWSEAINAENRRQLHAGLARDGHQGINW